MDNTISMAELLQLQSGLGSETTIPFGPYNGHHVATVPARYLRQICDDLVLANHPGLRHAILQWLKLIDEQPIMQDSEPAPNPPSDAK